MDQSTKLLFSPQVSIAQAIPNANPRMSVLGNTSPSAVNFQETLYLFFLGSGRDGVWYTTFDGVWVNFQSIKKQCTNMSVLDGTYPSAVVFLGKIFLFYIGTVKGIWYTTFDGASWSNPAVIIPTGGVDVMPNTSPNAVVGPDRKLYVFFTGIRDGIFYTIYDGTHWSPIVLSVKRSSANMSVLAGTSPSVALFQQHLFLFYAGSSGDGIWYTYSDPVEGGPWARGVWRLRDFMPGTPMGIQAGTSPAAWVSNVPDGPLYLFWNGSAADGLWVTSFDGHKWTAQESMVAAIGGQVVLAGSSPAVCEFRYLPQVFWHGANEAIWWSSERQFDLNLGTLEIVHQMEAGSSFGVRITDTDKQVIAFLADSLRVSPTAQQLTLGQLETSMIVVSADSGTIRERRSPAPSEADLEVSKPPRGVLSLTALLALAGILKYDVSIGWSLKAAPPPIPTLVFRPTI